MSVRVTEKIPALEATPLDVMCRSCGKKNLKSIISFGRSAFSDRLLTKEDLVKLEPNEDLELVYCPDCSLVQITKSVPPEVLFFDDYPYLSSVNPALLEHSRKNVEQLIRLLRLGPNSKVIELASNDGYLLKFFMAAGVPVLGIDPAGTPVRAALAAGVPTRKEFFTSEYAKKLVEEGERADVIIANNVLAHVPDLNGFVQGIRTILKDDGVAVIEVPYLVNLIDHTEFDTIYHQHLCYFSVTALVELFLHNGLCLNDVEPLSIHGGSLRLYVGKNKNPTPRLTSYLSEEHTRGVDSYTYYKDFRARTEAVRDRTVRLLSDLKKQGKCIAGYGAAAKANTFMHYCGIGGQFLEYIADINQFKQGKFMSGNHLRIVAPVMLAQDMPDYVLILAWNFAEDIMAMQKVYRDKGGKFIIPLPELRIV